MLSDNEAKLSGTVTMRHESTEKAFHEHHLTSCPDILILPQCVKQSKGGELIGNNRIR
jgi:hypothetical protein